MRLEFYLALPAAWAHGAACSKRAAAPHAPPLPLPRQVKPSDVDVLLKGGGALDITSVRKKPKDWIPDTVWLNVVALSAMDAFR